MIINKLKMDLQRRGITPIIDAVQGEDNARILELNLQDAGKPYRFPENMAVLIRYKKPNSQGKEYDTLEDGTLAWSTAGNKLSIRLIPQMLSFPGWVDVTVSLVAEGAVVSTFPIQLNVAPGANPPAKEEAEYFRVAGFLAAPGNATEGQYLQVTAVDDAGRVTGIKAVDVEIPEYEVVPSDWNAKEGEPGHILNRPFYSEEGTAAIVNNAQPLYNESEGLFMLMEVFPLIIGEQYTVSWNGVEYVCPAQDLSVMAAGFVGLGNLSIMAGENANLTGNGEPFVIIPSPNDGMTMIMPMDGTTELTLSITGSEETIYPIPAKYFGNLRGQKKYTLNLDTFACPNAPDIDEIDTGELQAALTVIYDQREHSASILHRESHEVNGTNWNSIAFAFMHSEQGTNPQVITGQWFGPTLQVLQENTVIKKYANTANVAFYVKRPGDATHMWHDIADIELPGIVLKSPSGTKFWITVDDNGTLNATAK